MHIKPYVVLGLATVCVSTGLGIVVTTSDPYTAEPVMMGLFWSSLFLSVLCLVATIWSVAGQRLAVALLIGFVWAIAVTTWLVLMRHGLSDKRLSGGIFLATLVLSFLIWKRLKK